MKYRMKYSMGPFSGYVYEEIDTDTNDAAFDAKQLLHFFNRTRRPGDIRRTFHSVEVLDKHSIEKHDWRKTSLVTEAGGYDRMKCERCGITGKRYGLGQHGVIRDKKYSAVKYCRCDDAKKSMDGTWRK